MWFRKRKRKDLAALCEKEEERCWQQMVDEATAEAANVDAILFHEHQATEAMEFRSPLVDSRLLPTTVTVPRPL